jgi:hypothetical protein
LFLGLSIEEFIECSELTLAFLFFYACVEKKLNKKKSTISIFEKTQNMSDSKDWVEVNEHGLLEVGDKVYVERATSGERGMETTVKEVNRKGRELKLGIKLGANTLVISLRKGGKWQEKGQKSSACCYTLYR